MAIVYNNKEYRNLQSQVLKNAQDIEVLKNRPILEIQIVDELPEVGQEGILYLVPSEDSSEGNLYEEYVWVNDTWEQVGSASIDLSNYATLDGDNEFAGENTFSDTTHFVGIETQGIVPSASNTYDIGADGKYFKEAKVNKYTVASAGYDITKDGSNMKIQADGNPIQFRGNIEPTVDGTYALGKSNVRFTTVNTSSIANDYSALSIKGKGGIIITCDNGSSVRPSQNEQLYLGSDGSRWNRIYVGANGIDFGNNAWIQKDGSNRLVFTFNGNTKIKVGNTETYFANHVEPDATDTYDLGRAAMRWKNLFVNNLIRSDLTPVPVDVIVTQPNYDNPNVWASGKLASGTGSATIDYTDVTGVGVPDWGLYLFTYGNAQCYVAFTESMWLGMLAGYPIRVSCPCLEEAGGSVEGNTGNLKIEKTSTTGIIKVTVASTITGSATSTNGWDFQFIKVI